MNSDSQTISNVPTNIITGFLGVGKTTAILNLLKYKPSNERWAVLVNEFGEIGIDGSLLQGLFTEEQGVFISEVPGGCMCCAAGLPMQIALNLLLVRAKPDRLLIEPTGLGHPIEVLESLSDEYYRDILSIEKTLTLVDARKLSERRYTEHKTFNQQIAIADIIVGNKQDLYQLEDETNLKTYVIEKAGPQVQVTFAVQGVFNPELLAGKTKIQTQSQPHSHKSTSNFMPSPNEIPSCGYLKAENYGEGYKSIGWRFSAIKVFDRTKLFTLLSGLKVERMKAVFITSSGIYGYNLADNTLLEMAIDETNESRIEIIATEIDEYLEVKLLDCIKNSCTKEQNLFQNES